MTGDIVNDQLVKDIIEKDIITLLHAEKLTDEEQDQIIGHAEEEISLRVLEKVDSMLSGKDKVDFAKVLDSHDQKALLEFFETKGIDIDQITAEITLLYKAQLFATVEYMNFGGQVGAAVDQNNRE